MVTILPSFAWGQDVAQPERVRLGPFGLTPKLVLSGGFDSNVLNRPSDEREDVVMDLRPSLEAALGRNRVRLATVTTGTLAYFRDYPGQGGMGVDHKARLEFVGNRVRPFVDASYMNANERFSLEIDDRTRRTQYSAGAGFEASLASKGTISAVVERSVYDFADVIDAQGRTLNLSLNRTTERASATVGYRHSPFTVFGLTTEARRDQFRAASRPEARSLRLLPSVEFRTAGLFSGRAEAGLLRFEPQVSDVSAFSGPVAAIALSYVLRDRTRFSVRVGRDLAYSADAPLAYYLQTGLSGSIGQAFGERWELRGTLEEQTLDYRSRSAAVPVEDLGGVGSFRVTTSRGQLEFRIRRDVRLSIVSELSRRSAGASIRGFEKVRVYSALTYGL